MKKTILLIEDNPDDEMVLLRAVQKLVSDEIVVAHDGEEALEYLFGTGRFEGRDVLDNPLLVMLDLDLPKVKGLEVLQRIRGDARTRPVPVVVISTSDREQDILDSYDCGANSYLYKPVNHKKFCDDMNTAVSYWFGTNLPPPISTAPCSTRVSPP